MLFKNIHSHARDTLMNLVVLPRVSKKHIISAILPSTYQNLFKLVEIWWSCNKIKTHCFLWDTGRSSGMCVAWKIWPITSSPFKVIGIDPDRSATYDCLIFPTPEYLVPPVRGRPTSWIILDGLKKLEWRPRKKFNNRFSCLDLIQECDRRTDRRTLADSKDRTYAWHHTVTKCNPISTISQQKLSPSML